MVREITTSRFVVLSPARRAISSAFHNRQGNSRQHSKLLASMQRFRGAIYASDGAVPVQALTEDGRHVAAGDDEAWHLISVGPTGSVRACLRYVEETDADDFDSLLVRHAAAAESDLGPAYRRAVERELVRARREGLRFGEVGGWAVDEKLRNSTESIKILLAMYGLLELLGGCLGVATATWRHQSAAILRRIGLSALESDGMELPPYFEPFYDCQMELLRFDSRNPNARYQEMVQNFSATLRTAPVYCAGDASRQVESETWDRFDLPELAVA